MQMPFLSLAETNLNTTNIWKNVLKKLTLNEKCEFANAEMLFVGHKIPERGQEADPSKVRAILHMPEPKADVSKVLGMANYLAKFLPQLASFTTPLKELLRLIGVGWATETNFSQIERDIEFTKSAGSIFTWKTDRSCCRCVILRHRRRVVTETKRWNMKTCDINFQQSKGYWEALCADWSHIYKVCILRFSLTINLSNHCWEADDWTNSHPGFSDFAFACFNLVFTFNMFQEKM